MAKKLPKKLGGVRIPKQLRKSKALRRLLENPAGRKLLADALVAGATAAAGVLVRHYQQSSLGEKGTTAKESGPLEEALHKATHAIVGVVAQAVDKVAPEHQPLRTSDPTRAEKSANG